jgi:hypothetical protein
MLKLCEDGPPDARVAKIDVREERGSVPSGFRVVRGDRF